MVNSLVKVRTSIDLHKAFYVSDTFRGGHFSESGFFSWVGWGGREGVGLGGGNHQFQDARALVELKGQVALYMAHSNIKQIITNHNKKYVCIEVN